MPNIQYPYSDGDTTVIGPECFAARDGSVLCWQGENYAPQRPTLRDRLRALVDRRRHHAENHG